MLFDPKSGSMVAVKSREEVTAAAEAAAVGIRKRTKKQTRSKEVAAAGRDSPMSNVTKTVRRPKEAGGGGSGCGGSPMTADDSPSVSATTKTPAPKPSRRLPRTCGVLYKRDDNGNCFCADECDGDLGYGAHSVPGGRAKNPEAYAEFVEQHQQLYKNGTADYDRRFDYDGDGDVTLYTGFNPEELVPEPIEYVRADDKLELVTGVDDSPSLKPTAKEWAPSQAALAAARVAAEHSRSKAVESSDEDDGFVVDVEDDDGPLGLGFDPTIDMDFVMQSPSHDEEAKRIESFAISALALEPPAFAATVDQSGPRHLFAFGTSGTWGLSHPSSTTSASDWKVPDVGDVSGLFGAGAFRADDAKATSSTTSFLNIPSSSSWGSSPTKLGGLTNGGGEASTTTTTGD
jgi:hypothetical protein